MVSSGSWHKVWLTGVQKKYWYMHSEASPKVTGARSSVQNCSAAMAAFQILYSHAIGQYSSACMLILLLECWEDIVI